ncbi:MAG: S1 RNA-binding domain-containing protein, partial [Spirochaetaceae bacterium]|nr:S1 RNA-binding domain-containing protein [Spirochaetaceae bacterium]
MEQMEVEKNEVSKNSIQTQLFEESLKSLGALEDGQLVEGTVVDVTAEYVFIDIGYKSEGKIPVAEFAGNLPNVGEVITVVLIKKDGRGGPEISKSKADAKQLWKDLRKAFDEKLPIEGVVEKTVKGGFEVNLGGDIHAFLPISQSDSQKVEKPEKLLGLKAEFYIERLFSDNKANVVVNRRKYLEEQIENNRERFFKEVNIGDTVKGTVKSFTSF